MAEPWFAATLGEIRSQTEEQFVQDCVGGLSRHLSFRAIAESQQWAWERTARTVHGWAASTPPLPAHWLLLFEYAPPLVTNRPDLVVVGDGFAVVIEAKTGETSAGVAARKQVLGYALDLYWFHPAARGIRVVPTLLRWNGRASAVTRVMPRPDEMPTSDMCHDFLAADVVPFLHELAAKYSTGELINVDEWRHAAYAPRPSIVDAAVALVAGNEDPGVSAALADDSELDRIALQLVSQVHRAAESGEHRLLLVTGVPGSGKTLVGLRLAHDPSVVQRLREIDPTPPLFLTGNGPLVDVLTEALARDFIRRRGRRRADAEREAKLMVKLVHSFTRAGLSGETSTDVPHVAIFDEGQRVWDADQMTAKHALAPGNEASEPEVILRRLEKRSWAVVVVLVGGGQEINTGEAGAHLWAEAVLSRNEEGAHWSAVGSPIALSLENEALTRSDVLHLRHSRRAVGAASLSEWVDLLLNGKSSEAAAVAREINGNYPILLARELNTARRWLARREPQARFGLVASSRSSRLRAYGIEMNTDFQASVDWPRWFLDRPPSLLSSTALEVAASEFKCQGLELDYVGVLWSWDLVRDGERWVTRRLPGDSLAWRESSGERRRFAMNAYRVLLTRARKGLVIWVPKGEAADSTRSPSEMDEVADYLTRCGVQSLADFEA